MTTITKAIKGTTTITADGFKTTHYYKSQFVGESNFKMSEHFGWTRNDDGTVTIAANRVDFNIYGLARGMGESLTNSYASAKTEGLAACIEGFKERLEDLYNGIIARSGGKKKEADIDIVQTTLTTVMFKSLIKDYGIKPKEALALSKSVDYAARHVAELAGKTPAMVRAAWDAAVQEELAELEM